MLQNQIHIPVFYGTFANLTKIDLDFMNARIVLYKGRHFREAFQKLLHPEVFQYSYLDAVYEDKNYIIIDSNRTRRYAIVPIDYNKPFLEEHWNHFHQMMLSIYPSDFALLEVIHLDLYKEQYEIGGKSIFDFKRSGSGYSDNFMFILPQEYKFVRSYLKRYFQSSLHLKYVKYILGVYSNSFSESNPIYQYLSLIICLEVTVEGNEQLTYKLRRNIALICGSNQDSCERIYENINQLYKLRSAIVHGDISPSYKNYREYHDYLKQLVARLIRELIVHNISTVTELNKRITALGYGQYDQISKNYSASRCPIVGNVRLFYKAIQKYKG